MNHADAERRRKELARHHPEATWLAVEKEPNDWEVVRVEIEPVSPALDETSEERGPVPDEDDLSTAYNPNLTPWNPTLYPGPARTDDPNVD
jgi:hypothetical protein